MKKLILLMLLANSLSAHAVKEKSQVDQSQKESVSEDKSSRQHNQESTDPGGAIENMFSYFDKKERGINVLNLSTSMWVDSYDDIFNVRTIKEDGTPEDVAVKVSLTSMENKKLCSICPMNAQFIGFTFGTDNSTNAERDYPRYEDLWLNRQTRFYDLVNKKFVEGDEFSSYELCDTGGIFPINSDKVLVKKTNDQSESYYYLNMITKEVSQDILAFTNAHTNHIDISRMEGTVTFPKTLVFDHKKDGTYDFLYAYNKKYRRFAEKNSLLNTLNINLSKLCTTEGAKIGLESHADWGTDMEPHDDLHVNNLKGVTIMGNDKTKIVVYKKNDQGFFVPLLLDGSGTQMKPQNILNDEQQKNLKSDVYDVKIKDKKIFYYTNFEKKEKNLSDLEISSDTNVKAELVNLLTSLCSKTKNNISLENKFNKIGILIQGQKDPEVKKQLERYQTQNFKDFLMKTVMEDDKRVEVMKSTGEITSDVIEITNTSFHMPVYTFMANPTSERSILSYHGGPNARIDNKITGEKMSFNWAGYNFVQHNFRGSSGFGTEYMNSLNGHWFDYTREDTDNVITYMRTKNLLPKNGLPIAFGVSFGGYAAVNAFVNNQCTHAIAINGTYDLNKAFNERSKQDNDRSEQDNDRSEQELYAMDIWLKRIGTTQEEQEKNSVHHKIKKREDAAMLIIAGSADLICLPAQSDTLFNKMKEVGNTVDYFKIEGMGHSPDTKEETILMCEIVNAWLAKVDKKQDQKFDKLKEHKKITYQGHPEAQEIEALVKRIPSCQQDL